MNRMFKGLVAAAFGLGTAAVYASPANLVIHNATNVEMNEYVDGMIPVLPTPAKRDGVVPWALIKMACYGHIVKGKCAALVKLATDTDKPFELGTITIDMETGDIHPKRLTIPKGYVLKVNGPGEATLTKE